MIFRGLIATDLSGSLGGITASRNKGGPYFRARVIPTNPSTPEQQVLRTAMTTLTVAWNDELTQAQRDAWDVYAFNVPLTNAIGEARTVSGLNMYVRGNIVAIQTGLPRQDTAPATFNLGSFTEPVILDANDGTQDIGISFSNTDDWANEDGSSMLFYVSRPQNTSIIFFKGPYRFSARVDGNSTTPPVSPVRVAAPFVLTLGQKVFVQARVCRDDGRLSGVFRGNVAVTTG